MSQATTRATTPNYQQRLRDAGWRSSAGQRCFRHTSGAVVRQSAGLWGAVRADGQRLDGILTRTTALAWALGADVSPWTPPARAEKAPPAPRSPDGWVFVGRGMSRHKNGTVDDGHTPVIATLKSGERRMFRDRRDAVLWVEGRGVFKPGHVPAERRSP